MLGTVKKKSTLGPVRLEKSLLKEIMDQAGTSVLPHLAKLDLELVNVETFMDSGRQTFRFVIDHPEVSEKPGSSITVDDCAQVSRLLDDILDSIYPKEGPDFVLEVSSPGLDRPLLKESDFIRFSGCLARLRLKREGKATVLRGRLETGTLPFRLLGQETVEFRFEEVVSARLIPEI